MNTKITAIFAASNVLLAAAVTFQAFRPQNATPVSVIQTAPAGEAPDLSPLLKPIATLDKSLGQFSATLQRFNTTIVQYDFLQKELERLGRLDQALAVRVNLEASKSADEESEEGTQMLKQLQQLHAQVQAETERRRQTMIQLIGGLEKELAASALNEEALSEALQGSAAVVPDPNPIPAPSALITPASIPSQEDPGSTSNTPPSSPASLPGVGGEVEDPE